MTNPFDDPEVRRTMAEAGIVHKPGMAAGMMRQLAPLLAAEGIDLDDPNGVDADLDAINAALARATAQHNLLLFTPVGAARDNALAVLRGVAQALADGDDAHAQFVLSRVHPDAPAGRPEPAHVIGVALGLLDDWHGDPALRAALAATRVPRWDRRARAAATDVLALARKGRAFDALDSLHLRHGGEAVMYGAAAAVAASVLSRAAHERTPAAELAETLLPGGQTPDVAGTVSAFVAWLDPHDAGSAAGAGRLLESLFAFADRAGLDLDLPEDLEEVVDALLEAEEPGESRATEQALMVLHDYARFRAADPDTEDADAWRDAADAVDDALAPDPAVDAIAAAFETADAIDDEVRRDALCGVRVVSAVGDLLDWLGTGRPCAPTGALRRADIEPVAALLGVRAIGVATRRGIDDAALADGEPHPPLQVQSMWQVPLLAAWWEALLTLELITSSSSRLRPGPAASDWRGDDLLAEQLIGAFVAASVLEGGEDDHDPFEDAAVAATLRALMAAIAPELAEPRRAESDDDPMTWLAERRIECLEHGGVVERDGDGAPTVVPALRGVVANGIVYTMARLAGADE